tara:strand:- start:203 stop:562 length:360 start_codon:yes stop_codon:yes gene_type:complete
MDEWERCVPWLKAALEKSGNTHTIWDVWTKISEGHAQFWPSPTWAAVTQLADYPRRKVLRIWLAGGNLDDLVKEGLPIAYDFAQHHGCDSVEVEGRKGWAKKLKEHGFKQEKVLLRKEA